MSHNKHDPRSKECDRYKYGSLHDNLDCCCTCPPPAKEAEEAEFARGRASIDVVPMGVCQWQNYGAKWGYDKYFDDRLTQARQDLIVGVRGVMGEKMEKGTPDHQQDGESRGYNALHDRITDYLDNEEKK